MVLVVVAPKIVQMYVCSNNSKNAQVYKEKMVVSPGPAPPSPLHQFDLTEADEIHHLAGAFPPPQHS